LICDREEIDTIFSLDDADIAQDLGVPLDLAERVLAIYDRSQIHRLTQRNEELTQQVQVLQRRAHYVILPEELQLVTDATFLILDPTQTYPIGNGFFISGNRAVTALHNLGGLALRALCTIRYQGTDRQIRLIQARRALDVAFLEPVGWVTQSYLRVALNRPLEKGVRITLIHFPIALSEQQVDLPLEVAATPGSLVNSTRYHIYYESVNAGRGSCGGAIVLKDLQVVGLHLEAVNEAQNRQLQAAGLDDTASALDSVVASFAEGFVGVNLCGFLIP